MQITAIAPSRFTPVEQALSIIGEGQGFAADVLNQGLSPNTVSQLEQAQKYAVQGADLIRDNPTWFAPAENAEQETRNGVKELQLALGFAKSEIHPDAAAAAVREHTNNAYNEFESALEALNNID